MVGHPGHLHAGSDGSRAAPAQAGRRAGIRAWSGLDVRMMAFRLNVDFG